MSESREASEKNEERRRFPLQIRFYQELNFFLKDEYKKRTIETDATEGQTVKDLLESFGVPHVEVDLILVDSGEEKAGGGKQELGGEEKDGGKQENVGDEKKGGELDGAATRGGAKGGEPVDFSYQVGKNDYISVYPVFERLDVSGVSKLRPEPLREPRFIADVHLGTLARRLRFLGFYTEYSRHADDAYLAERCAGEGLILCTRDRQLLMRRIVERGIYIRATDPFEQVREVVGRLDLYSKIRTYSRCASCNGELRRLPIEGAEWERRKEEIPPGVRQWCKEFKVCTDCGKIYWKGSHFEKLKPLLEMLEADAQKNL